MKMICPCCNTEIDVPTYYSKHKEKFQQKYEKNKKNPDWLEKRHQIALKSYHKRKNERK